MYREDEGQDVPLYSYREEEKLEVSVYKGGAGGFFIFCIPA
jgi:hypothetical protein